MFNAITGCGLDVLNDKPLCSLSQLTDRPPSMERVLANIMARFSVYWDEFLLGGGSFASFEGRYKRVWLHRRVMSNNSRVPLLTLFNAVSGAEASDFVVTAKERHARYRD